MIVLNEYGGINAEETYALIVDRLRPHRFEAGTTKRLVASRLCQAAYNYAENRKAVKRAVSQATGELEDIKDSVEKGQGHMTTNPKPTSTRMVGYLRDLKESRNDLIDADHLALAEFGPCLTLSPEQKVVFRNEVNGKTTEQGVVENIDEEAKELLIHWSGQEEHSEGFVVEFSDHEMLRRIYPYKEGETT